MASAFVTTDDWGPLAHPVRGSIPPGEPQWRDNAYLCFWDFKQLLFGAIHVSTSPNGGGSRARSSVSFDGDTVEVVEPLPTGSFQSQSINFDLPGRIVLANEGLSGYLETRPRFEVADYHESSALPQLDASRPVNHYQQVATVTGELTVHGQTVQLDGAGIRDRTWGFRDESGTMEEFVAVLAVFPEYGVSAMRFRTPGGHDQADGFILGQGGGRVTELSLTRDASGLVTEATVGLSNHQRTTLTMTKRLGGFWVPMGPDATEGPAISTYDDFATVRTDGEDFGSCVFEQGILRTMY
jgi:hypothetical protein